MKRFLIWTGIVVALIAMVYGLARLGSAPARESDGTLQDPITAADHVKGSAIAKTTLVEYADFQCPACAAYFPLMQQLEKKYAGSVQFVYRNFPLPMHEHARIAAQAAEAAGNQGKFWEMHDLLFQNQSSWAGAKNPTDIFKQYATSLKLNVDQFSSDLTSAVTKARVERDEASGARANVEATPTFFLNGTKLHLNTYADLDTTLGQTVGAP